MYAGEDACAVGTEGDVFAGGVAGGVCEPEGGAVARGYDPGWKWDVKGVADVVAAGVEGEGGLDGEGEGGA